MSTALRSARHLSMSLKFSGEEYLCVARYTSDFSIGPWSERLALATSKASIMGYVLL
eukprot:CAMPEP_0181417344 /NCGR_PEP_ID=MMETSP1110-20121109/10991_1 /TAXON_ID=174948 /ORGANISM="Symbiodinium sp., Strain CCMP421" /LENGTH=56 /DNA_ID=CAMNT_0023540289 /DNA_START=368 /DNA_END=538 /DNA_ORIENTATION=+